MLIPHVYASIEDEFTWPSEINKDNLEKTKCLGGTTHIGILVNGDVVLCCLDSGGKTTLGSLKKQTLKDIVESKEFNKIVTDMKNGKPYFDICKKCTYRNRFK
jgi:radical SAM protein with 4Fe4S-binding SPASM domain